jgi:hypothetical protein
MKSIMKVFCKLDKNFMVFTDLILYIKMWIFLGVNIMIEVFYHILQTFHYKPFYIIILQTFFCYEFSPFIVYCELAYIFIFQFHPRDHNI